MSFARATPARKENTVASEATFRVKRSGSRVRVSSGMAIKPCDESR